MIMAGGAGTRLWPMSRTGQPKQLIPLIRDGRGDVAAPAKSLLQIAAERMDGLVDPARRYICTGEAYRAPIRAALPQFTDDRILGEPAARDTVNAVGFTAAVLQKLDKDAIFAVFTADHVIEPQSVFRERVEVGFKLVEQDPKRLVTFSIKPTYAATGFGYIERGSPFTDKWATGRRFKPESYDGLMKIQAAWGTKDQNRVLNEVYPTLPKISVDYAIMEPASTDSQVSVATVEMDLKWLDVGSWPSYGETLTPDADGNRRGGNLTPDKGLAVQSRNNLIVSSDPTHTVSLLGCDDMIVVHTPDATLVMPRAKAEELKALHGILPSNLK